MLKNENFYVPTEVFSGSYHGRFMRSSIPIIDDFYHNDFLKFLGLIRHRFLIHRKLWEFAFIWHKLVCAGVIGAGRTGLCFGAGKEPLPSVFAAAGCRITATDAPPGTTHGDWTLADEHANQRDDLFRSDILNREEFEARVSFRLCDMNNIDRNLKDFDFCWSACCLEHLGSLQHGIDFIVQSIEATLKPGGFACHTTEMNLTSDQETLETPNLSLYRRRDLISLGKMLESRGHRVEPINIEMGASAVDHYIDLPPFSGLPHVKVQLEEYVSTSVGLLIQRGP